VLTRPPDVSEGDVADAVAEGWGRRATHVEYAPVGFGSHHWAVTMPDGRLFATLDDLIARRRHATEPPAETRRRLEAALSTARALRDGASSSSSLRWPRSPSTSGTSGRRTSNPTDSTQAWRNLTHFLDPSRWAPGA
jgi:hypothetical protein